NKDNDYLQDREMQRTVNFSGIKGIQAQDMAVIESMGAISDRTREHLGTSDSAILGARRRLLREVANFQEGIEPEAPHNGDLYWVRSAAVEAPQSMPMLDVAEQYMAVEKSTLAKQSTT
ncbi:MAG: aromatic ring-hydroxylating dioxygenase subunit alpha, partial [Chloroflexota bacterium]|nr:aromatic ring-hydroxylating dioxygenase subunit alpha [Chloroflexota bacterium]